MWRFRELIGFFALRDLRVRYKQAAFGALWALVQPVVGALAMTLVFHQLAGIHSGSTPYVITTMVGYVGWTYVSSTVTTMTGSFLANAPLVTKVYFPRLTMPLGALLPGIVDLVGGLVVLAVFMIVYGVAPTIAVVTLPLWILALAATAFGAGLLLASLNVQFRDVGQIVGLLVQMWFFVSPVAYPSTLITGKGRWLYHINPLAGVIDGLRWSVIAGPAPSAPALLSLASMLVIFVFATRYFLRTERRLADII